MITIKMDMLGIPRLPRLRAEEMGEAAAAAARGVTLAVTKNFDRLNARSGNSSFWGDAANSVGVESITGAEGAQRGMAAVVVRQRGVRLHWLGGDVQATGRVSAVTGRPTRALLIPFEDSPLRKQRKTLAEMHYPEDQLHVIKSKGGCPLLVAEDSKKKRTNLVWLGKLVKKAHFEPRPEVMPSEETMHAAAVENVKDYIETIKNGR